MFVSSSAMLLSLCVYPNKLQQFMALRAGGKGR